MGEEHLEMQENFNIPRLQSEVLLGEQEEGIPSISLNHTSYCFGCGQSSFLLLFHSSLISNIFFLYRIPHEHAIVAS